MADTCGQAWVCDLIRHTDHGLTLDQLRYATGWSLGRTRRVLRSLLASGDVVTAAKTRDLRYCLPGAAS